MPRVTSNCWCMIGQYSATSLFHNFSERSGFRTMDSIVSISLHASQGRISIRFLIWIVPPSNIQMCSLFKKNNLILKSLRMATIYFGLPLLLVMMISSSFNNNNSYAFGSSNFNFNFAAAGDFGCNDDTKDTIENMVDRDPELVLGLGDYSYKTSIQCWLDILEPINKQIVKISIGNHEAFSNSRTSLSPNEFDKLMENFNLTTQYHSFNHENVHFLSISTELRDLQEEKNQFNFVSKDLFNASVDPEIDWIIVFFHKPFYALPTKHHGPEETKALKDIYLPLFEEYNVNLVLQGHNHNYERSKPNMYSRRL